MNYDLYLRRRYIPALDGLRAICVILVITHHVRDQTYWSWLVGQLGVTVFFVISGYLITSLCVREEKRFGAVSLKAFFLRRSLRILPLYYVTLVVYCFLMFGLGVLPEKRPYFQEALPYYLTYMQELPTFYREILLGPGSPPAPLSHSWSLGIEEKFYLLWPLLAFVAWRGATSKRQVWTFVIAMGLGFFPILQAQEYAEKLSLGLAMLIGALIPYAKILWGCFLATLLEEPKWFARLNFLGQRGPLGMLTLSVVGLQLSLSYCKAMPRVYAGIDALYVIVVGLFIVGVVVGQGGICRVLAWPPLVMVGKLSYGIYLFHVIALNAVQRGIGVLLPHLVGTFSGSLIELILGGILAIAIAAVTYRMIEQPLIALGRQWSQKILNRRAISSCWGVGEPLVVDIRPLGTDSHK